MQTEPERYYFGLECQRKLSKWSPIVVCVQTMPRKQPCEPLKPSVPITPLEEDWN